MHLLAALLGLLSLVLGIYFRKGKEAYYEEPKVSVAGLIMIGLALLVGSLISWLAS